MMFADFFRKVSMKMTKLKKKRAKKDGSPKGPKTRKMVKCNCTLCCNGSKLVDSASRPVFGLRFQTILTGNWFENFLK